MLSIDFITKLKTWHSLTLACRTVKFLGNMSPSFSCGIRAVRLTYCTMLM